MAKPLTVIERMRSVISKEFRIDPEKVTPEAYIHDNLGLDSMDDVQLLMVLEKEFHVSLHPSSLFNVSVNDLALLIEAKLPLRDAEFDDYLKGV